MKCRTHAEPLRIHVGAGQSRPYPAPARRRSTFHAPTSVSSLKTLAMGLCTIGVVSADHLVSQGVSALRRSGQIDQVHVVSDFEFAPLERGIIDATIEGALEGGATSVWIPLQTQDELIKRYAYVLEAVGTTVNRGRAPVRIQLPDDAPPNERWVSKVLSDPRTIPHALSIYPEEGFSSQRFVDDPGFGVGSFHEVYSLWSMEGRNAAVDPLSGLPHHLPIYDDHPEWTDELLRASHGIFERASALRNPALVFVSKGPKALAKGLLQHLIGKGHSAIEMSLAGGAEATLVAPGRSLEALRIFAEDHRGRVVLHAPQAPSDPLNDGGELEGTDDASLMFMGIVGGGVVCVLAYCAMRKYAAQPPQAAQPAAPQGKSKRRRAGLSPAEPDGSTGRSPAATAAAVAPVARARSHQVLVEPRRAAQDVRARLEDMRKDDLNQYLVRELLPALAAALETDDARGVAAAAGLFAGALANCAPGQMASRLKVLNIDFDSMEQLVAEAIELRGAEPSLLDAAELLAELHVLARLATGMLSRERNDDFQVLQWSSDSDGKPKAPKPGLATPAPFTRPAEPAISNRRVDRGHILKAAKSLARQQLTSGQRLVMAGVRVGDSVWLPKKHFWPHIHVNKDGAWYKKADGHHLPLTSGDQLQAANVEAAMADAIAALPHDTTMPAFLEHLRGM